MFDHSSHGSQIQRLSTSRRLLLVDLSKCTFLSNEPMCLSTSKGLRITQKSIIHVSHYTGTGERFWWHLMSSFLIVLLCIRIICPEETICSSVKVMKRKRQRKTCCAVRKVVLFVFRKTSRKWCRSLSSSSNLRRRALSVPSLQKGSIEKLSSSSSCFGVFCSVCIVGVSWFVKLEKAKEKAKADVVMLLVGYHGKEVAQCSC